MPRWTEDEDALLRKHLPTMTVQSYADRFGKTRLSVDARARRLGVQSIRRAKPWTPEELRVLESGWREYASRGLRKRLPGRSWKAICHKAMECGLGPRLQGYLSLTKAAKVVGVCHQLLWKIIHAEGVEYRLGNVSKHRTYYVDEVDISEAATRFFDRRRAAEKGLETLEAASARLKVCPKTLRVARQYAQAKPSHGRKLLETPERWDEVLRIYKDIMKVRRARACRRNLQLARAARKKREAGLVATAPSASRIARSSRRKSSVSSSGVSTVSRETPDTSSTPGCAKTGSVPTSTRQKKSA